MHQIDEADDSTVVSRRAGTPSAGTRRQTAMPNDESPPAERRETTVNESSDAARLPLAKRAVII